MKLFPLSITQGHILNNKQLCQMLKCSIQFKFSAMLTTFHISDHPQRPLPTWATPQPAHFTFQSGTKVFGNFTGKFSL